MAGLLTGDETMHSTPSAPAYDFPVLARQIKAWGKELGFEDIGISGIDLSAAEAGFLAWLADGCHGEMDYMAKHGLKRSRPDELVPGTVRVLTARMNYLPGAVRPAEEVLADAEAAYISRYALGRDYHKVLRSRLQKLADRISSACPEAACRVFTDSGPVLEVALSAQSGLGWRGKHTLLLSRQAGSFFFLGEIYINLPLPEDVPVAEHCGKCTACIDACPTGAITAPYRVDARRCISYLTIELDGPVPEDLRPQIGNRIYGCDDCQLVCPWNRFARLSAEPDFQARHHLDNVTLAELFAWDEATFQSRMAGSPIYRIGYERWLRNLAIALGNAPSSESVLAALAARRNDPSPLIREHVDWALAQHEARQSV